MFLISSVYAGDYGLYMPDKYNKAPADEHILFILDFSNSMKEYLDIGRKVDVMLDTMAKILPGIPLTTSVGLRVYGHRMGFSAFEACHASSLLVPIGTNNSYDIKNALFSVKPKGMTPITYSLKQAVKKDFLGIKGKKRIILLTDGGENCDESPCKYAMELLKVRKDISIDVIALNIDDDDDIEQLQCAALVTSGKFYTANTSAELIKSLSDSVSVKKDVDAKIIFKN